MSNLSMRALSTQEICSDEVVMMTDIPRWDSLMDSSSRKKQQCTAEDKAFPALSRLSVSLDLMIASASSKMTMTGELLFLLALSSRIRKDEPAWFPFESSSDPVMMTEEAPEAAAIALALRVFPTNVPSTKDNFRDRQAADDA